MASDDVGNEPGGEGSPFKLGASGSHRSENATPPAPFSSAYAPLLVPILLAAAFNVIAPCTEHFIRPSDVYGIAAIFLLVGIGAGQLGLLATWAVLGPWPLYRQWFEAMLVGIGLFLAFLAGIVTANPREGLPPRTIFLQMILAVFGLLFAVQLPLWLVRLLRGWRLVLRSADATRTAIESRQLQIRDILIATTIVAVALGATNLVCRERDGQLDLEATIVVLCVGGGAAAWSALLLPMCLWVCFGGSALHVRIGWFVGYLGGLAAIAASLVAAFSTRQREVPEICGCFLVLHVGLLATVFSGLGLARACGYVLVSVRSARRRQAPLDGGQHAARP